MSPRVSNLIIHYRYIHVCEGNVKKEVVYENTFI